MLPLLVSVLPAPTVLLPHPLSRSTVKSHPLLPATSRPLAELHPKLAGTPPVLHNSPSGLIPLTPTLTLTASLCFIAGTGHPPWSRPRSLSGLDLLLQPPFSTTALHHRRKLPARRRPGRRVLRLYHPLHHLPSLLLH